ncbi:hypothetical protein NDU88_006452 [Pleurodeles waltl]|uniref:Uncharacterized protein n=1 Tax=Pleurodeles waltl TaxID=8319 RepID=A0AAV7X1K9_PLEWA|nr:hypothetical protein NDU88_006452 [Pleurodeles waltl]
MVAQLSRSPGPPQTYRAPRPGSPASLSAAHSRCQHGKHKSKKVPAPPSSGTSAQTQGQPRRSRRPDRPKPWEPPHTNNKEETAVRYDRRSGLKAESYALPPIPGHHSQQHLRSPGPTGNTEEAQSGVPPGATGRTRTEARDGHRQPALAKP